MTRRSEAAWNDAKSYWQINVQKDGTRRSFYSSLKGRKGKHEAEAKADDWLANGAHASDMKLADAWKIYITDLEKRSSKANYKSHECAGRLYIVPALGSMKLSKITAVDWRRCISDAAKNNLSRRYLLNIRAAIMAFLTFAEDSLWAFNPVQAKKITIPNSAAPEKEKRILQPEDIRVLFSDDTYNYREGCRRTAHYIYLWRFIVVTGLRRGEAVGLKWEDVSDDTVTVRRSINEQNEETFGKNNNARRSFAMTEVARSVLDGQRDYLKSIGVISPWVFPAEDGSRADPHSVYLHWRSYSTQHGFRTTIHELRHTFVSLGKDLPLEMMKSVVGHSTSMDTYGIYGHDVDGESKRAAQIIDGVFSGILG